MNDITNLSDTVIAKSDQLNADDLIGGPIVVTITGVSRGNIENPLSVNYQNDNGRPFKPCKTMRRLLVAAWGVDGNEWIGKSMQLYNDSTVKWAGKEHGGVRISHLSHIKKRLEVSLSSTRGKKQMYKIDILQVQQPAQYPDEKFNSAFPTMEKMILDGKITHQQAINKCLTTGELSQVQMDRINSIVIAKADSEETGSVEGKF